MPAWWSRKSSKNKQEHEDKEEEEEEPRGGLQFNFMKSPITIKNGDKKKKKKNSFDELFNRNSPRTSNDFNGGGAAEKKDLPLPLPADHAVGSPSISGSSFSSSVSYDDHPISPQFNANRGQDDIKFNVRSKSPGPGSRGPTSPTSPLHPRLHVLSLDSPTGKQEDGRSQCHPLPLPPGSPTSPSALSNTRANGQLENISSNLSKWKKGKLLGRGTFGHVYLGFNSENGQMCAIKEVRVVSDDQTSKECLKQLNQEINLLSHFSHPNIVQYYGSELVEESLSVYLEYVSGGSIHKLLQEYGSFKEPVIQNYTRQIVSGLAYLHGRNTVHRDIKGANILVDPNGEIKLADFGMAKHINSSASMLSFKGSPYWMAPEVVMNANGYSLPVDIWSLGCTILEMATSKPPWSQYEGVAAIFKIGNSKDMPEIPEHLSNDAKNFIKLCLNRDPLARPTALKLLDHPFIRDQSATKAANVSITRDAFPYMFDGSRTPPVFELHSNRTSITSLDGDYATKPALAAPRTSRSPRDNSRMITSLPVSPSSSPLRHYGPAHQSCFFSPPHPSYTIMGQNSYTPVRSNATFTLDPWHESSLYKAHTPPGGSPRMRFI
ncbi:mitogen-activated protein kinase kinase kinase 3-like [Gastrolobium bilobum]|uniref:mitogen-activated protein kinase kinase kinase 3-like n=1 Tax=Gastrolobium bilobum TaxID=150636 RepID=UPI002AB2FCD3|nr:mitogen-activated protein kinase kinase kinase 3-like [Gastrolobium bilobum]XP_061346832.1 mitogen-activated protein kinase kinase kinase 3-like [Gastrolobium bilobum]